MTIEPWTSLAEFESHVEKVAAAIGDRVSILKLNRYYKANGGKLTDGHTRKVLKAMDTRYLAILERVIPEVADTLGLNPTQRQFSNALSERGFVFRHDELQKHYASIKESHAHLFRKVETQRLTLRISSPAEQELLKTFSKVTGLENGQAVLFCMRALALANSRGQINLPLLAIDTHRLTEASIEKLPNYLKANLKKAK